jgi:hypothetical protein
MKQSEQLAEIKISYRPAISNKPIIKSSLDAYNVVAPFFPTNTIALQDKFVAMYLNRANRMLEGNKSNTNIPKVFVFITRRSEVQISSSLQIKIYYKM